MRIETYYKDHTYYEDGGGLGFFGGLIVRQVSGPTTSPPEVLLRDSFGCGSVILKRKQALKVVQALQAWLADTET